MIDDIRKGPRHQGVIAIQCSTQRPLGAVRQIDERGLMLISNQGTLEYARRKSPASAATPGVTLIRLPADENLVGVRIDPLGEDGNGDDGVPRCGTAEGDERRSRPLCRLIGSGADGSRTLPRAVRTSR